DGGDGAADAGVLAQLEAAGQIPQPYGPVGAAGEGGAAVGGDGDGVDATLVGGDAFSVLAGGGREGFLPSEDVITQVLAGPDARLLAVVAAQGARLPQAEDADGDGSSAGQGEGPAAAALSEVDADESGDDGEAGQGEGGAGRPAGGRGAVLVRVGE